MDMYTLENGALKLVVHPKGAELQSIEHQAYRLEYLWGADPAFWGKHSPLLFPIVGSLKGDTFYYRDKAYRLSRHGFARDSLFELEERQSDQLSFLLKSSPASLTLFPFEFELRVRYRILPQGLQTTYLVKNSGLEDLYFSIGGHPAFRVPLEPQAAYQDYYLEFEKTEQTPRWPISKEGLIEKEPLPLLENSRRLPLSKELFSKDALVLKHPASSSVTLRSDKSERGLRMDFEGFPYLGIWAAKNADFVCIEPWCGIADSVDSDQDLLHKEGINRLPTGEVFERTWSLTVF